MNAKEHWKGEHAASETYHLHKSKHHENRSNALEKLATHFAEADDDEAAAAFRKLAEIDKSMSSIEAERANHHRQAAALVDSMSDGPYTRKTVGVSSDPSDALLPDQVMGIIGEIPQIRAIPRAGQPAISERQNVPLELQKFVSNPEDENALY